MAAEKYKKPCFDSSIFIGGLGDGEIAKGIKRHVVFRFLWDKAKAGAFPVRISAITLAEVYKKQKCQTPSSGVLDEFLSYVNEPFVQIVEVDREVGLSAHALCRKYADVKLSPNDALHLACALRAQCDFLLAWDGPLADVKHPDIKIEEPVIYDPDLFAETEVATPKEIAEYDARIEAERTRRNNAGSALQKEKRFREAAELADRIIAASAAGSLTAPFTTRAIRLMFKGDYDDAHFSKVLPGFCQGGCYVQSGKPAKFERLNKGQYRCL